MEDLRKHPAPHDILIIEKEALVRQEIPAWFKLGGDTFYAVVRRDYSPDGFIPVGIRGRTRSERYGFFIHSGFIRECLTPPEVIQRIPSFPRQDELTEFLSIILSIDFPFLWGVTGSVGYSLATGQKFWNKESDLDFHIYLESEPSALFFEPWLKALNTCPVRVDTQIESPFGGFALKEWLNSSRVLLKTNKGPIIVQNPWSPF